MIAYAIELRLFYASSAIFCAVLHRLAEGLLVPSLSVKLSQITQISQINRWWFLLPCLPDRTGLKSVWSESGTLKRNSVFSVYSVDKEKSDSSDYVPMKNNNPPMMMTIHGSPR